MKQLKLLFSTLMLISLISFSSCNSDEDTCMVTVQSGEGGTAIVSKSEVISGSEVTLTAIPEEGYEFVNWVVNGVEVSKENPYVVVIYNNTQYTANFKVIKVEENGHAYVDLGLSVKWATCNIGATTPEEYGDYFAWGETSPKTEYLPNNYKYSNGTSSVMTKYCSDSSYGIVDNKTVLELSDDAARVNWGGSWRMPTAEEQEELKDTNNCTWTWTTQNGVNGYKVTSKKNGNSIFLPAAGHRYRSILDNVGRSGYYWSSSLSTIDNSCADNINFWDFAVGWERYSGRATGWSVRAVCE